jgi:hypothetical protein
MKMKRRTLLKSLALSGAVAMARPDLFAGAEKYDKYGGWPELKFKRTGFFGLTQQNDRWWCISPEGNAFLINQMDHVGAFRLTADFNKAFWAKKFGISADAPMSDFMPGFYQKVKDDQQVMGFNAMHNTATPDPKDSFIPYIRRFSTIKNSYWEKQIKSSDFKDVFSDQFAKEVDNAAKFQVARRKDDPYLIGWHFTDSPILSDFEAMPFGIGYYHKKLPGTVTWPQRLRNLGAEAPGKHAYVDLMKRRYGDIAAFNDTYCSAFKTFDDLIRARDWKPLNDYLGNYREEADNKAFQLEILDKAYTVQVETVKKYDPNHLIFGDRLNCNAPLDDDIIKLFGKHFDVLSFQFYGTWEDFSPLMERLYKQSGKPLHGADSSFAVANENMPNPLGIVCANQKIRAEQYKECHYNSYALPYFIGWGWCGWVDAWPSSEPGMQHSGIQDAFGNFDQPIVGEMKKFSEVMYDVHMNRL